MSKNVLPQKVVFAIFGMYPNFIDGIGEILAQSRLYTAVWILFNKQG